MSDLVSMVVSLRPTARAATRADLGPACQAWFLALVRAADPALAAALHDGSQRRPYTVSSLRGVGPARGGLVTLAPDRPLWVRFTTLETRLSATLLEVMVPRLPGRVAVGDVELAVEGATVDPADHSWAGSSSYEVLLEQHLLASSLPRRTVGLSFTSPTAFRQTGGQFEGQRIRDHDQLFPLPALVFGSLADTWQSFSPIELERDVRALAASCLAARRFRLATRLVDDGRGRQRGVSGSCQYQILNSDPQWQRLAHMLAAFSFYCGVGRGTAAGWGQTRAALG